MSMWVQWLLLVTVCALVIIQISQWHLIKDLNDRMDWHNKVAPHTGMIAVYEAINDTTHAWTSRFDGRMLLHERETSDLLRELYKRLDAKQDKPLLRRDTDKKAKP